MALNSVFKTLKALRAAKRLTGDDALAQRAVRAIEQGFALRGRAYEMGHAQGHEGCDFVMSYAALALGHLDNQHRYAFLNEKELPIDVRGMYKMNLAGGFKFESNTVEELVKVAEAGCREIDQDIPKPSVVIHGGKHRHILRGAHALTAIAMMGPPANQNTLAA
jgi:hypothetical protein